jgi:hypothetical protein
LAAKEIAAEPELPFKLNNSFTPSRKERKGLKIWKSKEM